MRFITFLIALLSFYLCSGQTNTTYYRYGYGGVPERVGYSETRPAPKLFSDYVPTVDPYLYGSVLAEKQRRYDANLQSLSPIVNDIINILNEIKQYDISYWNEASEFINKYFQSIKRYDFGNTQVYNSVYDYLYSIKSVLENNRRVVMDNYYKRKYQNQQPEPYRSTITSSVEEDEKGAIQKKETTYSGVVAVNTCSPVLINPNVMSEHLVAACNGKVTIIKKYDEKFYHVDYQGKRGYLYYGWILKR